VQLWDAANGEPRASLIATANVNALSFSRDGALLLTAQGDGNVGVWDHAAGRQLGAIPTDGGSVYAVALSGDGRLLATGGNDGAVSLWDVPRILDSASFGGPNSGLGSASSL
jgi:WD40 repeat protein